MQLDHEQQAAATSSAANTFVQAGAGSGKTRVIIERVAYMIEQQQISAHEVMAITYTRRAAMEMESRLRDRIGRQANNVWIGTIHSWCLEQLYRFGEYTGWRPAEMTVFDDQQRTEMLNWTLEDLGHRKNGKTVKIKATDIKRAFFAFETLNVMPDQEKEPVLWTILSRFRQNCREANALTYPAILTESLALLGDGLALGLIRKDFRHLILDECQDTTPLQWDILNLLAPTTRFVVGDMRQSIFSFAGSNIDRTLSETMSSVTFFLSKNYRSDQCIVDEGNRAMHEYSPTEAARPEHNQILQEPCDSESVVRLVTDAMAMGGYGPGDIAMLCRVHRPLAKSVAALKAAGLPVYYPHEQVAFNDHPDTKAIHACLSLHVNPWDLFAFRTFAKHGGMSALRMQEFRAHAATRMIPILQAWNELCGWAPDDPPLLIQDKYDPDIMQKIIDNLERFKRPDVDEKQQIHDYLKWHATKDMQSGLEEPPSDQITALSIHQAKGLEWPCVIILGASEGILPSSRATDREELDEERRLYYVAVTRARDMLVICPRPDAEPSRFIGVQCPAAI